MVYSPGTDVSATIMIDYNAEISTSNIDCTILSVEAIEKTCDRSEKQEQGKQIKITKQEKQKPKKQKENYPCLALGISVVKSPQQSDVQSMASRDRVATG